MSNLEKYNNAFVEAFEIDVEKLEGLTYQGIPEWDSVGHMSLVACIEDAFDIISFHHDIKCILNTGNKTHMTNRIPLRNSLIG